VPQPRPLQAPPPSNHHAIHRRRGRAGQRVPQPRPLQARPPSHRHVILLRRGGGNVTTARSSRAPPNAPGAKRPSRRWCP
jgi:hypothetical protein